MHRFIAGCLGVGAFALCLGAAAGEPIEAVDETAAARAALQQLLPQRAPDSIRRAPVGGLFEVLYGGEVWYVSEDGRYLIEGELHDLATRSNLTEERRAAARRALLDAVPLSERVVFAPERTRHVVDVFTDVDCPYCRKMHAQIAEYNRLGIEVRYLAYPRSGPNTPSYFKSVSVWCAADRRAAMTEAKAGREPEPRTCDHPVDRHIALADRIGLTGTPTIVFADGTVVPGYVPAAQLNKLLEESDAR